MQRTSRTDRFHRPVPCSPHLKNPTRRTRIRGVPPSVRPRSQRYSCCRSGQRRQKTFWEGARAAAVDDSESDDRKARNEKVVARGSQGIGIVDAAASESSESESGQSANDAGSEARRRRRRDGEEAPPGAVASAT